AARAYAATLGAPAGPVHCNLPFREPLVPTGDALVATPGRRGGAPWTRVSRSPQSADVGALTELVRAHGMGVIVAGWGARVRPEAAQALTRATGWPVLADPLSQLRCNGAISTYEALARVDAFAAAHRPDVVLRIGAPLTSKVTNQWLAPVPAVLVDPDAGW